jgi:hypothetical protein
MIRDRSSDPIDGLPRKDRRAWRTAERRVRHEHEIEQMVTLNGLAAAGGGMTGMSGGPELAPAAAAAEGTDVALALSGLASPVEFIIDGRRLRLGRTHRPTLAKLRDALSRAAALPLTRVGRYGPYWVLTFRVATDQLVLLAEHLTLLPDVGGPGGLELAPAGPLSSAGV